MRFKRFTKPGFLKEIGRHWLHQFFSRFTADLAAAHITLPPVELEDEAYFEALARIAIAPDGLPDDLIEAMYEVEEMANHEGQERLEAGVTEAGLDLVFDEQSSHADVAIQVWLAAPDLLSAKHSEMRLRRLSAFQYFGTNKPVDRATPFTSPTEAALALMTQDCEAWFPKHNRGEHTTQIEVRSIDGEFWFIVCHGDTFARTPKVENQRTEVLHFRPAVDDVVVYAPNRDEIRIHARTKGEKELYRTTFGHRLFGDPEYFNQRRAYSLEPLRGEGEDALDAEGLEGVQRIVLREIEWAWDNAHQEVLIHKADDVFAAAAEREGRQWSIPAGVRLVRALFDFHFEGAPTPRWVELRPPNVLKLGRRCDARVAHEWISARGFRVNAIEEAVQAAPAATAEEGAAIAGGAMAEPATAIQG